jgi:eukaryotic-like serine/threonine-protein kinase
VDRAQLAVVWLAWDGQLTRQLALKILRGDTDGLTLARFEREARATSQLSSPHTVRIFDFGASDDGVYFIAMEYLRGLDLRQLVQRQGPLAPARAVHFSLQACRSLIEAHEYGIVHRDIKPANLFVTRIDDDEDGLKVLDFGLARVRQPDVRSTFSQPGSAVGTPAYMAPETLDGSPADERSDIYSLGATLYHLLTGGPPFDVPHLRALFVAHLTERPPPISARRGGRVPPRLEQVVDRCLEKQPSQRFASVRELAEALAGSLDGPAWTHDDARHAWDALRLGDADTASVRVAQA